MKLFVRRILLAGRARILDRRGDTRLMTLPCSSSRVAGLTLASALLLAPLLPGPLHAQSAAPAPDSILAALTDVPWGVSCAQWAADRGASCTRFHGDGAMRGLEELWCRRSTEPGTGSVVYFHVLDPGADPPACGLTELQWRTELTPGSGDIRLELERRLTAAYGPPEEPEEVNGPGSYWWRDVRRFHAPWGQVFLYQVVDRAGRPLRVHLRARSRARAMRVRESPRHLWFGELLALPDPDSLLRAAGDPSWPGIGLIGAPIDTAAAPRAELDALAAATARADSGGPDAAGLLLLADLLMQRLAGWASVHADDSPRTGPVVREVERMGAQLVWDPLGFGFSNSGGYLRRLWEGYPDSPFGQLAFARLQATGWDTTGMCSGGPDEFRDVIRRGRGFLAAYPSSAIEDVVVLTLAVAHETWWSLAQAEGDTYADARDYQAGAQEAREAAIRWYEEVLAGDPSPRLRTYATERLALLRLGLDTDQRAFHCIYD